MHKQGQSYAHTHAHAQAHAHAHAQAHAYRSIRTHNTLAHAHAHRVTGSKNDTEFGNDDHPRREQDSQEPPEEEWAPE